MTDTEKRRQWRKKLNDWQDSSRDPPIHPGCKTQMLRELRKAVGADVLPFGSVFHLAVHLVFRSVLVSSRKSGIVCKDMCL